MNTGRSQQDSDNSTCNNDVPRGDGGLIIDINENDVLKGRGGKVNKHVGNVQFRKLLAMYRPAYMSKAIKKIEKSNISSKIIQTIRNMDPPGRFLVEVDGGWFEIGDKEARRKTSQAIREVKIEKSKPYDYACGEESPRHDEQNSEVIEIGSKKRPLDTLYVIEPDSKESLSELDLNISRLQKQKRYHSMKNERSTHILPTFTLQSVFGESSVTMTNITGAITIDSLTVPITPETDDALPPAPGSIGILPKRKSIKRSIGSCNAVDSQIPPSSSEMDDNLLSSKVPIGTLTKIDSINKCIVETFYNVA